MSHKYLQPHIYNEHIFFSSTSSRNVHILASLPTLLPTSLLNPPGEGKMFSPGNLRATFDNPNYERLVNYWIGEKYTLRYTGGMVPDVFQIIVKEKGVFSNVTSPTSKAKLRVLFEVAPLGLLVRFLLVCVEIAVGTSTHPHPFCCTG